jgi:hypothetical protein
MAGARSSSEGRDILEIITINMNDANYYNSKNKPLPEIKEINNVILKIK